MNFQGERTILVHHNKRSYKLPKLPASAWVYLTSMNSGSEKIFPALLNYLKKGRVSNDGTRHDSAESNKIKLAFNPGTFQMKLGMNALRPILAQTAAIFVNLEEAGRILGTPEEKDTHRLTRNLAALGPKIVVITNGAKGAHAWDEKGCYFMSILKEAPLVEMTGAGDAFAGAFVAALLYNQSISEALRWGTFNSASVIGKIGPEAGLLGLREMKRQLVNYETLVAQACTI
jgi:sugar/nucleoside kinase (ribokinase family)